MAVFNKDEEYKVEPIVEEAEQQELSPPDFYEMVSMLTGRDELGKSYTVAYLSVAYKDLAELDGDFDPIEEMTMTGPDFAFERVENPDGTSSLLHVQITFTNSYTKDLIGMWKILEKYKEYQSEVKDEDTMIPICSLLLKPNRKREIDPTGILWFMNLDFPVHWEVSADYPGRPANRIDLFFNWDYCAILRNLVSMEETKEIINQEKIRARAQYEEEKKAEEEKAAKEEEYLYEMQEKIKADMFHAEEDQQITRVGRGHNDV